MTRETKIGLLVGMAFIVVFAVLLSHTGTIPPPGESPATVIVQNTIPNAVLDTGVHGEVGHPEPRPAEPTPAKEETPAPESAQPPAEAIAHAGNTTDPELPRPTAFEPTRTEVATAAKPRDAAVELPPMITGLARAMPPVAPSDPQPSVRPIGPVASLPPESSRGPEAMVLVSNNAVGSTPSQPLTSKEHVVQSGDSLYKLADKYYKSRDPKYIDVIVKANGLKDANTVVEGQKLAIPELPADMFDAPRAIDTRVAANSHKPESMNLEDIERGLRGKTASKTGTNNHKAAAPPAKPASTPGEITTVNQKPGDEMSMTLGELGSPKPDTKDTAARTGKPSKDATNKNKETSKDAGKAGSKESKPPHEAKPLHENRPNRVLAENKEKDKADDLYRWYEVKSKDTLQNIARDNLESGHRWEEIKKLNPDLNPQKMKPGDRIKVPRAKPLSRATDIGRESA